MKNNITKILGLLALILLAPLPAHAAKLALSPASGNFTNGCATAANIIINTEGQDSMAADAFLFYNPDEIDIVDQMGGVSGIQLRPGSVYESYPGNIVSNGVIRLTAFNRQGYYNGRGIMGSIVFKAKPGIKSTSIRFDYRPGATTDSNVADVASNDMLNGAYGATYTFAPGKCGEDSTPPTTEGMNPAQDQVGVPLDGKVTFVLKDNLSGVDINTLKVQVNDTTYTKTGDSKFTYTGSPNKYTITITPTQNFLDHAPVRVKINVKDLDGNAMAEKTYSFNNLMPVEACVPQKPVVCAPGETLRSAAPEVIGVTSWWPWWFVLLCSLILNLKLWTSRQKQNQPEKIRTVFGFKKREVKNEPKRIAVKLKRKK
jgi:hypothetical protein